MTVTAPRGQVASEFKIQNLLKLQIRQISRGGHFLFQQDHDIGELESQGLNLPLGFSQSFLEKFDFVHRGYSSPSLSRRHKV